MLSDQIAQTPKGFWYVKGDWRLPAWMEETGRIDHDIWAMGWIRPYVRERSLVIDVGANIGTHTAAYLDMVGPQGIVAAFEPYIPAFECLRLNCPKAHPFNMALSDVIGWQSMDVCSDNPGANRMVHDPHGDIMVSTLDYEFVANIETDTELPVSFIKIDVEGCEPEVLRGGAKLISRHRPAMYIEVNNGALEKRGHFWQEIEWFMRDLCYLVRFPAQGTTWESPQSDILCVPQEMGWKN